MPMSGARFERFPRPGGIRIGRRAIASALGGGVVGLAAPAVIAAQDQYGCSREELCQIHGVTGGGVVQAVTGAINLLLFASHFAREMSVPAFSKLSWRDANWQDGLELVNSGPIFYPHGAPGSFERELKGIVRVNGGEEHPFHLLIWSSAEIPDSFDMCRMSAGDAVSGSSGGWSYEAEGPLVGGELVVIHTDRPE